MNKIPRFVAMSLKIGIGIAVLLIGLGIALYFTLPWLPIFDDGPFNGNPCSKNNPLVANDRFPLNSKIDLHYGLADSTTVILKAFEGKNEKWCREIFGKMDGDTRELKLIKKIWVPFFGYRVIGLVNWTYGEERALLDIDSKGELRKYYFSW